jgi:hypothetical protein
VQTARGPSFSDEMVACAEREGLEAGLAEVAGLETGFFVLDADREASEGRIKVAHILHTVDGHLKRWLHPAKQETTPIDPLEVGVRLDLLCALWPESGITLQQETEQ